MLEGIKVQAHNRMNAEGDDRQRLSALMDGDADARDLAELGALWRDDADLRGTWHTYHLIGDVLRSDDLASAPARDEAFLQALRQRLAAEPVVLAPVAVDAQALAAARRRRSWLAPAAAAAGFVAVAGVLIVLRGPSTPTDDARLAKASPGVPAVQPVSVNTPVLRDARLDRYLEAHRRMGPGVMTAMPSARPIEAMAIDTK